MGNWQQPSNMLVNCACPKIQPVGVCCTIYPSNEIVCVNSRVLCFFLFLPNDENSLLSKLEKIYFQK